MVKIEAYCAKDVFNPPAYSQAVKVTGAQTMLFQSGQVAYDEKGGPAHRGDIVGQAREVFRAIMAQVEAGGGTLANVVKLNTYLTDVRHMSYIRRGITIEIFTGKRSSPRAFPQITVVESYDISC